MIPLDIDLPPGVLGNGTRAQSSGGWWMSNLVRWVARKAKPMPGWRKRGASACSGKVRAIFTWGFESGRYTALGSHTHLYTQTPSGVLSDRTPTLSSATLNNPFTTTNGSPVVTVADTAHGMTAGARVTISGSAAVGGITPSGTYTPTIVDANSYTITHGSNATSSVAGGGGASVAVAYSLNPGRPDALVGAGYGAGIYGAGAYGTIRPDSGNPLEATVWSLDSFDGVLVAVQPQDGTVYEWDPDTAPARATATTNAPSCKALFVAPENALVALAADDNDRRVAYSDRDNRTTWTPASTNKAGDFDLKTSGAIMCGAAVGRRSIIITTVDAWVLEKRDGLLVYSYDRVGIGCGIVSRCPPAVIGREAVWMSDGAFKKFDGASVADLPCPVQERVFGDINTAQLTKVVQRHNSAEGEVRFSYPSGGSTENDRQAVWNYREGYWTVDEIARTALTDRGVFAFPLSVDSSGYVYEDEVGSAYDGATPYAITGPLNLGLATGRPGDRARRFTLRYLEPDSGELGGIEATFTLRSRTMGDDSERGPYVLSDKTPIRGTGREADVRFDFTTAAGEIGLFRLLMVPRGER